MAGSYAAKLLFLLQDPVAAVILTVIGIAALLVSTLVPRNIEHNARREAAKRPTRRLRRHSRGPAPRQAKPEPEVIKLHGRTWTIVQTPKASSVTFSCTMTTSAASKAQHSALLPVSPILQQPPKDASQQDRTPSAREVSKLGASSDASQPKGCSQYSHNRQNVVMGFPMEQPRLSEQSSSNSAAPAVCSTGRIWTVEDSARLYNVKGWGQPYFSINAAGNVCVAPRGDASVTVDLYGLLQSMRELGLQTPCLFRFPDIVSHRIDQLQGCFDKAIARYNYQNCFRGVFPVKCNHDRLLLSSILEHGQPRHNFGLEAGSKPELVLAISLLAKYAGSTLVCNGFKDSEYMELVLHSRQLGINTIVVLEQPSELDILLQASSRLGVAPVIGIRAKLSTCHDGHWGTTSGDNAKFGLRPAEIVSVVDQLAAAGKLQLLQLLHFHAGSQITSIRIVKEAVQEAAFLYAELAAMGAPMGFLDVGGGLAIDYDGSQTSTSASLSYTTQQYANDVIATIRDVCAQRTIAVPVIVSESGRALASHHAVMVFDVLDGPSRSYPKEHGQLGSSKQLAVITRSSAAPESAAKAAFLLKEAAGALATLDGQPSAAAISEAYADARFAKEEALKAFKLGFLTLHDRAAIDRQFSVVCARIHAVAAARQLPLPQPLLPQHRSHSTIFHVNLSIFRSAPDIWAIKQLFPIMPLHRLGEEPSVSATLADITCDSDGKIDTFISPDGGKPLPVLPLHEREASKPYYLAMLLGGVYQESLGSPHNMLGSINTVYVRADPSSTCPAVDSGKYAGHGAVALSHEGKLAGDGFVVENYTRGETIQEVLDRAGHKRTAIIADVRSGARTAIYEGRMAIPSADLVTKRFKHSLASYTYLKH